MELKGVTAFIIQLYFKISDLTNSYYTNKKILILLEKFLHFYPRFFSSELWRFSAVSLHKALTGLVLCDNTK